MFSLICDKYNRDKDYYRSTIGIDDSIISRLKEKKTSIEEEILQLQNACQFQLDESVLDSYGLVKPMEPQMPKGRILSMPTPPVFEKAGLFNKAKINAHNEELQRQYEIDLRDFNDYQCARTAYETNMISYSQALNSFNISKQTVYDREKMKWEDLHRSDIESHKKQIIGLEEEKAKIARDIEDPSDLIAHFLSNSAEAVLKNTCDEEIQKCIDLLEKNYQVKSDLESLNVIYPKYLSIVALTTMYEYFITGRVSELSGPHGAYNLYESEVRANRIIEQLDLISSQLEQIKENQHLLYSELISINRNLSSLSNKMSTAVQELKELNSNAALIAYNTEATAHYAKLNAQLTDSLGFLIALK